MSPTDEMETKPVLYRALITGGAGFIGSHLAETLLERGHQVTVIDDLSTGKFENIRPLIDHPRFRFAIDSITNPLVWTGWQVSVILFFTWRLRWVSC